MNNTSIKKQTISGAIWKFCERISGQIISFIVSVILARILLPNDYGLIALVFVFTTLCDKLVVCGFATSLIQKKNADEKDFSSVFYLSLCIAAILYAFLFLGAPAIADFYDKFDREQLISIIRVLGLGLFIMALNSVQQAYVSKNMLFKRNFYSSLGGVVVSGIIGISMAYKGYGVWALVAQNLITTITSAIILLLTVRWYPKLCFYVKRLKELFAYGWKIFLSSIIKMLYNDLRSLVIGKFFTPADLAYYNRGQTLPQLVDTNITGTIDSVLFPAYSKLQDEKPAMIAAMRRAVKTSCYILMPALSLMAAVSTPLVVLLLTDKWLPCVPYMQILCFSFMFSPVETENLQSIKAIGRSDIVLRLEIAKRSIGVLLLAISVPFGLLAIALSMLLGNIIAALLNASPNNKLIGYSIRSQIKDILPSLLMSLLVYAGVSMVIDNLSTTNCWIQLTIGIGAGLSIYVLTSYLFKVESFLYIKSMILTSINRNK